MAYLRTKSPDAITVNTYIALKEKFCLDAIEVARKFIDGLFAAVKAKAVSRTDDE